MRGQSEGLGSALAVIAMVSPSLRYLHLATAVSPESMSTIVAARVSHLVRDVLIKALCKLLDVETARCRLTM